MNHKHDSAASSLLNLEDDDDFFDDDHNSIVPTKFNLTEELHMRPSDEDQVIKADPVSFKDMLKKLPRFHFRKLRHLAPIVTWLPKYQIKRDWLQDLICGLTVGVMSVPQGIAYALLSGLPPIFGLYTSLVPPLLYVFFGQSPQVSMGPFALNALLFSTALQKLVPNFNTQLAGEDDPQGPIHSEIAGITATFTFCVGVLQLGMALFRLGFVAAYLSPPLTSGFTTATAVYIFASQVPSWFGVHTPHYNGLASVFQTIYHVLANIKETNGCAFLLCSFGMVLLYSMKWYNNGGKINFRRKPGQKFIVSPTATSIKPKYPIPSELVWVIIATLMSYAGDFEKKYDLIVVGKIPAGLPPLSPPSAFGPVLSTLISDMIVITVITYAFTMSLAKSFAGKFGYIVKANKELYAMGVINFVSSFFSSFVVCAGLSRSLVLAAMNAPTQLNNLVSVVIVIITLTTLTAAFYPLPQCALSSIIFISLIGMFHQFHDAWQYWKVKTKDFVIWMITFCATLALNIPYGMGCAVLISIVIVLYGTAKPYYTQLVPIVGSELYRDIARVRNPTYVPHIFIYRFHASLNFANADFFQSALYFRTVKKTNPPNGPLHSIVIDFSAVNEVDSTAATVLVSMFKDLNEKHKIRLLLASVRGHVRDVLEKLHFSQVVGMRAIFPSVHEAVLFAIKNGDTADYLLPSPRTEDETILAIDDSATGQATAHVMELKTMELEKSLQNNNVDSQTLGRLEVAEIQLSFNHPALASEYFVRGLELARSANSNAYAVQALFGLGRCDFQLNNYPTALRRFEELLEVSTLSGDQAAIIKAYLWIGKVFSVMKEHEKAIASLVQAVDTSRQAQHDVLEAEVLFELANAYRDAGKHDEGSEVHAKAIELTKQVLPKLDGASKANLAKYFEE